MREERYSRHLYDICKLMPQVNLDKEIDLLIDEVRDDRIHSKNNPSAKLDYDIPEILNEIIQSRFYEHDYKCITQKLLYEDVGSPLKIIWFSVKITQVKSFENTPSF